MPYDITMCPGGTCPLRMRCYRYRGVPVGRQDWFGESPFDEARGVCDHLWELAEPTEDAIRMRAYDLWLAAGRPTDDAVARWVRARAELSDAARLLVRDDLPRATALPSDDGTVIGDARASA